MSANLPVSEELLVHELKSIAYIASKWQQIIEKGHLPSDNPNVQMDKPEDLPPNMEQILILLRNELMLIQGKASALSEIIHENVG